MNAIVEVATATVAARVDGPVVLATVSSPKVAFPQMVATSALRVLSQGTHSISAVAPDAIILNGGLALGAAA